MTLSGGCLCGAVRFRTSDQPLLVRHCHCEMCRKASGSAFMTGMLYRMDAVRWRGAVQSYESSPGVLRTFCGICGSSLGFRQRDAAAREFLLLGSFDDPRKIEINDNVDHVYAERELGWIRIDDDFPRAEGLPQGLVRAG